MNHMISVASLLGIDINEIFRIKFNTYINPYKDCWYKLTEDGLMYAFRPDGNFTRSKALEGLLVGKHKVIK